MGWHPHLKTRPDPSAPPFVDPDLFESGQVQELWVVDGAVGPEVMAWRDGKFVFWMPCLTRERARAWGIGGGIGWP